MAKSGVPGEQYFKQMTRDEFFKINHLFQPNAPGVDLNVWGHVCKGTGGCKNADLLAAVLFCSIVFQVEFQPCGQVAGAIREIEPAHVVFNRMLLGARDQLDRMNRCRL